jgi:spermidine synthase
LGLGGNTTTQLIQIQNPNVHLTIVEIEKNIMIACKEWFNLEKLINPSIILSDAFKIVKSKNKIGSNYNAIVVDIFNGQSGPLHTREIGFLSSLPSLLASGGTIIFNWPANSGKTKNESKVITQYYEKLNFKVIKKYVADSRGYKNYVIVIR